MAGKIIADQIEHSTAGSLDTSYVVNGAAKQWVLYDSVVSATSVDNSFNTSSVTDEGTGDTTVAITNSMSNGLYSMSGLCSDFHVADKDAAGLDPTSTRYRICTFYVSGTAGNRSFNEEDRTSTQIFGDLA